MMNEMNDQKACVNTDRELWRETPGDYYAPRVFVTEGGGIGIDVGGMVYVKPVRDWHALAKALTSPPAPSGWQPIESAPKDAGDVLITGDGILAIGYWNGERWVTPIADQISRPSHWMPVPAGPDCEKPFYATDAPSGWQQRIAALQRYSEGEACMYPSLGGKWVLLEQVKDALAEGQNAKDALPLTPEASPATMVPHETPGAH